MKQSWFKFVIILFFILLMTSFAIINVQAKIYEVELRTIKSNYPDSLVYSFQIETSTGYDFLSCDEFVLSEEVDNYIFTIQYLPDQVSLSSVKIKLASPGGQIFENTIEKQQWFNEKKSPISLQVYNFPLKFNETGIWYLEFNFNTNKEVLPWEFTGFARNFNDYSNVRTTYRYQRTNYYKKGITVFSLNELVQLRAAKAAEETAETYKYSLWLFGATAVFSAIAAGVSYWNTSIYAKRRKEESILHLIKEAINPSISEFKDLENSIKKIKNGKIVTLPTFINSEVLYGSQWSDFRREFPFHFLNFVKFKNIQKYLKKKNEYNDLRDECLKKINEDVKNLGINKFEKFLVKPMKDSRFKGNFEDFFKERIAECLSVNILHDEKTNNDCANELFEKYRNIFYKIRNKPTISKKIKKAIELSKKLAKFQNLHKKLNLYNRDYLMRKYQLTDYDLEKFKKVK